MAISASHLFNRKPVADDERLLRLFWNRAELKKEFAEITRERDRLRDKLRQQEGATLRAQQQLEQLEGMLADPVQAANAAVFYQLRGVWLLCRKRMARLVQDLAEHQQVLEHKGAVARFDLTRNAALNSLEQRIGNTRQRLSAIEQEYEVSRARYQKLRGVWNYFRRRRAVANLVPLESSLELARAQLATLQEERDQKRAQSQPAFEGLTLDGKRRINLGIIALAQELYLHFAAHDVSALAREASVRNIADVNYGRVSDCRELNYQIEQLLRRLQMLDGANARMRIRSRYLAKQAQYRRDSDTVPVAGSFAAIVVDPDLDPDSDADSDAAAGTTLPINVLADEYWDIYKILLT